MADPVPQRMSTGLKVAVYAAFGGLWVSGCVWIVLREFFSQSGEFGTIQHPWAPTVLRLHGWIAVSGVFLLGWLMARHVSDRWPQTAKRFSGVAIAGAAGILAITGYALYYTTDGLHDAAALVHEVLGVGGILFALSHWRRLRSRKGARSWASDPASGEHT